MNIRDWPLGQIMQLPDCCFGRRFVVSVSSFLTGPGTAWDISELAIPELSVLWELMVSGGDVTLVDCGIRLALGDQLPTTAAMMAAYSPLIPGLGVQGPEPRLIQCSPRLCIHLVNVRQPIEAMGRRLVLEHLSGPGEVLHVQVSMVVSSIPTEVPDCLIS